MSLNDLDESSYLPSDVGKPLNPHAGFKHAPRTYKRLNQREAFARDISPKSPGHQENKAQINFHLPQGIRPVSKERTSSKKSKTRINTSDYRENQKIEYDHPTQISCISQEYEPSSLVLSPKEEPYNTRVIEPDQKKELLKKFMRSKKKDVEIKHSQGNSKIALYSPYSTANSSSIVSFNKKMRASHARRGSFLKQDTHSSDKRIKMSPGPSLRKLSNVASQKSDLDQSDDILNKTAPFKSSCVKIRNQSLNNTFINYKPPVAFPTIKINEQAHTNIPSKKDAESPCFTEDLKLQRTGSVPSRINDVSFDREVSSEPKEKSLMHVPELNCTFSNTDNQSKWVPLRVEKEKASSKQKLATETKKTEENKRNDPKPTVQQQQHRVIKVFPVQAEQKVNKNGENNNITNGERVRFVMKSDSPQQVKTYSRPQSQQKSYAQKESSPVQRESEFAYPSTLKFTRLEMHPKFSVKERFELILVSL